MFSSFIKKRGVPAQISNNCAPSFNRIDFVVIISYIELPWLEKWYLLSYSKSCDGVFALLVFLIQIVHNKWLNN